ncbi:unnamed protein product, partial [Mesorhabditis belari]|uniref:Solute-binding protein family 3/N-terminal domain-containing protein n=1 Tax=Mesorhabditis belari TaxID=2138241 RepID=A0AAF3ESL2_9BILA
MSCKQPGIDVEFLNLALRMSGLEAEVIPVDYQIEALLEAIANGSADISVHSITQSIERMQFVTFTTPINYLASGYIAKETNDLEIREFIFGSIAPEIFLFMLFALFVSPFMMWFLSGHRRSYASWFLHSGRIWLKQDGKIKRRYTTSNAFFMISWSWFCFFFMHYYESAMKSNLTLSSKKGYEFQDIEGMLDVLDHKGWRLAVQESGWDYQMFCKTQQQIERVEHHLKTAIRYPFGYEIKTLPPKSVMFSGSYSYLVESDVSYIDKKAKTLFIKDVTLPKRNLAFAVNKNLTTVREKLNKAISMMQGGYNNMASRYSQPYSPFVRQESLKESYALRLAYLKPLFRICGILVGVAIAIIIVEVILVSEKQLKIIPFPFATREVSLPRLNPKTTLHKEFAYRIYSFAYRIYSESSQYVIKLEFAWSRIVLGDADYKAFDITSFSWDADYKAFEITSFSWDADYKAFDITSFSWDADYKAFDITSFSWDADYKPFDITSFSWDADYKAFDITSYIINLSETFPPCFSLTTKESVDEAPFGMIDLTL